jgi:GPH family glycoside/pentoside/hexuronide:cation symporter
LSKEVGERRHSRLNMASYGFGNFMNEFVAMAFGTYAFFFYEIELGLNVWLVTAGFFLYAVYNAINDPLVGYLTNKPFKFTKKWGRRFPWILIGGIPFVISYILIFTPPTLNPVSDAWLLFLWLVFTTCLFDTFASVFWVNFSALFADKFRSVKERRTATGLQIPIGLVGVALGAIIPPIFLTEGIVSTYVIQAGAVIIVGLIALGAAIPGVRDDQDAVDRYLETHKAREKGLSFFKSLASALKQKSFLAFIVSYTLYRTLVQSMTASVPYVAINLVGMTDDAAILIFAGFLIGALVSTPIWVIIAHKTNDNKKVMVLCGLLMGIFTIPLIFLENYIAIVIALLIWGLSIGGYWAMIAPVLADVIDESVVKLKKRQEGVYAGFQQFFGRLAILFQAVSFGLTHTFANFPLGFAADPFSASAKVAIHIHLAIVPMICILIGTLVFWKWYDLTPDKVAENQKKIIELNL